MDASSDEEVLVRSNRGRHVVPRTDGESVPATQAHVVDALEEDLGRGHAPFSRRVVLHPQSSGGTPRSVQDRSPDMSMGGNRFAALAGAETVSMPDMDDAVATQPAQVPLPTCVDEEPQEEYPRQRRRLQLISQSTRVLGADTAASEGPPRHPTVVPLTESEGSITSAASSDTESVPGNQDFESQEAQHVEEVQLGRVLREALRSLDGVDVGHLFSMRAVLMKSPPAFVKGAYRAGLRIALKEIIQGIERGDEVRSWRGWKLFLLVPRMLLFRPPRGGLIPKQRLLDRFQMFARGEWMQLLSASRDCGEKALSASIRRRRTQQDSRERRAERAQTMVMMGEVSAGRRVLEGAPLAPGTEATLKKLRQNH